MFQVSIVIFREFLEISILLSLFSAVAKNIKDYKIYLITGILIGCVGASIIAFFTDQIADSLDGVGSEIFDASVILITVAMLCSTLIWMKNYSKKLKGTVANLSSNIESGSVSKAMFVSLIATTMFREGSEIVLLLRSISTIEQDKAYIYLNGFAIGSLSGIAFGIAIYYGLFRFASRYIFAISSFFMSFIAAGLSAEAAKILSSIGVINCFSEIIWDTSWIVKDESILGRILKIAIGYTARPIGLEAIFYLSTLLIIIIMGQIFSGKRSQ